MRATVLYVCNIVGSLFKLYFWEIFNVPRSIDRVGRFLSDAFPIHCGLKQGDALSPLLFNFALEHGCANHDTEGKRFSAPPTAVT